MKISGKLKFIIVLTCIGAAYLGIQLVKSLTNAPETQMLKNNFPDFAEFSPSPLTHADFMDRKKILVEWKKDTSQVKMEVLYKISFSEAENLIKQNDLETFNLFIKQPSPYPGVLTQQAGRDCPEDFVPQVEDKDDETSFVHKTKFFVKQDQNLGACAKEEIAYVRYNLQQYCKLDGIFLEINYSIPIADENKEHLQFNKLICPKAIELSLIK